MVPPAFRPDISSALDGPAWLRERRATAMAGLADAALPSTELEEWRYSRIDDLVLDDYPPLEVSSAPAGAIPAEVAAVVDAVGARAGCIVVRDGSVATVELDGALAAAGVRFEPLTASGEPSLAEHLTSVEPAVGSDPFDALNVAFAAAPLALVVPRGCVVELPFVVVHVAEHDRAATFPRLEVAAGENSHCRVVEAFVSLDVDALVVPRTTLRLEQAARVHYESVQRLGPRVHQLGALLAEVGQSATLEAVHSAMGGDFARMRSDCVLSGRGATGNLSALYFGTGDQMHDLRTFQTHDAPDTTSNLVFQGVVDDRARSVYTGLIRVGTEARGTNANQTNRNIKLSDEAWAESVPNLEIHQNDVRCSHASAVGPIDADQRFYLESRGVPPEVAERLVVTGFFDDVVERFASAGLRELVRGDVDRKLGAAR